MQAYALLAAGDLPGAELLQRRSEQTWTPDWGRYHVAHAAALAERGDLEGAGSALLQVSPGWQEHPVYWRVRRQVAEAAGDGEWLSIADTRLRSLRRNVWPGDLESPRLESWQQILLPDTPASTLEILPWAAGRQGGIVEAEIDGTYLGTWAATVGETIEISVAIDETLHLLTLRRVAGDTLAPGPVRIR